MSVSLLKKRRRRRRLKKKKNYKDLFPENVDKSLYQKSNTCWSCIRKVIHLKEHFTDGKEKEDSRPSWKDSLWISSGSWEVTTPWWTKRPQVVTQEKPTARSITRNQRSKGTIITYQAPCVSPQQHRRGQVNQIFSRDADYNVWSTGMF